MLTEEERRRNKALAPAAAPAALPTDIPKNIRRDAAMFAPVTNYMQGNDAAAGKLVDSRLKRSGQPLPSTVGPPAPAGLAQPPQQQGFMQRWAPTSMGNIQYGATPRPGEGIAGMAGRGTMGASGIVTALPEAAARGLVQGAKDLAGGVGNFVRGFAGAPAAATASAPTSAAPAGVLTPGQPARPATATGTPPPVAGGAGVTAPQAATSAQSKPAPLAVPPFTGTNAVGRANAAAPGQVALSEQTQQPLPGAPKVGANGEVVYDDNWQRSNQQLVKDYETRNGVQTVVPGAGVAGGMLAQTPQVGQMRRAPGFTQADRLQQLDALDRLGGNARNRQSFETLQAAGAAARAGNFRTARALTEAGTAMSGAVSNELANPRVGQLQRSNPDAAAANAIDQQRANQDAAVQAQEIAGMQVDTAGKKLSLQQQQRMAGLTEMLMSGDETARAKAVADIAALTGTKQGQPIKLKQQFDTGQKDATGTPIMGEKEILVDWNGNRLDQDAGGQAAAGANGMQPIPYNEALQMLRENDTPATRAAFQQVYNTDPAKILGR